MDAHNYATHCDTEVKFFETLTEAEIEAVHQIDVSRREANDGWDETLTEGICVMKVIRRAEKVDPNVEYRCVDYKLATVES